MGAYTYGAPQMGGGDGALAATINGQPPISTCIFNNMVATTKLLVTMALQRLGLPQRINEDVLTSD